jgi:vacuolar-type H+-ATPase subunit F/Vma7
MEDRTVSHRVAVVGDATVALGFRLAGVRPHVVDSKAAADELLSRMIDDPQWGVILVQEDMLSDQPRGTRRRASAGLPVLVPFPAPSLARLPGEAEAYVAELLRRAVGYRVRLR